MRNSESPSGGFIVYKLGRQMKGSADNILVLVAYSHSTIWPRFGSLLEENSDLSLRATVLGQVACWLESIARLPNNSPVSSYFSFE
jgi:hypothetical protein